MWTTSLLPAKEWKVGDRCRHFDLIAICDNAMEANKILFREKIDLMFLDIQMPGMRGIDFLKTLSDKAPGDHYDGLSEFCVGGV